jgi:predicted DNA-binding transcriptional regulator YafY
LIVLEVLRQHSDADRRLSQTEIASHLQREHGLRPDRKTLRSALACLVDAGYPVLYSGVQRVGRSGEPETLATNWYLQHDFSDLELRLLVDSLIFSHQLPQKQRNELIGKVERLSSRHFRARVKNVTSLAPTATDEQMLNTVALLDQAIGDKHRVSFKYGYLGADKRFHLTGWEHSGEARTYEVSPYQLVATNDHYYLICAAWQIDALSHYRVDRIAEARILDRRARPLKELSGYADGRLDLPQYLAEHLFMSVGPSTRVRFRIARSAIHHVFDWFGAGPDVRISHVTAESVGVTVCIAADAMRHWALLFAEWTEVLEPTSLREQLRADSEGLARKYSPNASATMAN